MPSKIAKGSKYEKMVEDFYKSRGYRTHRNPKSRFGKQDILGIADVVATKADDFVLIACTSNKRGDALTETLRKIKALRPFVPGYVRIEYRILKDGGQEKIRMF